MLICQVCSICIWFMYLWFFKFVHCIMQGLLYGMDGIDHKMRKNGMVLRCSRCKQADHNKSNCKMTPYTQPDHGSQTKASE